MGLKRKISIRKILQLTVTVIAVTGCVMAMLSASSVQVSKQVAGLDIRIKNDQYHFIDKQEVLNILFANRNIDLYKIKLSKLDANQMERIIYANPWVERAQVYVDNKRVLHIYITQRVPVARLFEQNGNSYYLDHTLSQMPLSDRYIHYTTVVTNVPVLKEDSFGNSMKAQIVALVKHIDKDSFWNAQISQVMLTDNYQFEMVPVLGEQRILFGDTSRMQEKFDNLFAFYKKVLNRVGWDKYQILDVRFAGQVVASPALEWKKPADKMMSNMDWVKNIIGNEAKPTTPDTSNVIIANTIINAVANTQPVANTTNLPKPQVAAVAKQPLMAKEEKAPKPQATAPIKQPVAAKEVKSATPQVASAVKHSAAAKEVETKPKLQASAQAVKKENKKQVTATHNKEKEKTEPKPRYLYQGNNQ